MSEYITKYGFEIGEFTYGMPVIRWWGEDAKLKIGRFCSIAANVRIYLGGNHRPECITSYPFPAIIRRTTPKRRAANIPSGQVMSRVFLVVCDRVTRSAAA